MYGFISLIATMNLKFNIRTLAALLLTLTCLTGRALVWNPERLKYVKENVSRPYYRESLRSLTEKADPLLGCRPLSVMDKEKCAPSGDPHDYLSQARYFWPNPDTPDGLPYINRDGISNPEIERLDRNPLGMTANRIKTLALAYHLTGDERYARKAAELVRVWFLDKKTAMNPNLEYAQMIPGQNGGKGRCYGLLDAYSFVEMLDGVTLLEGSPAFTGKDSKRLKKWFGSLTDWMLTSPQGKEEAMQANNHSTAYDAMIMAFALYSGNRDIAEKVAREVPVKRIFTQIEPDGRQPHELSRTLAYGYSEYNLSHFLDILQMALNEGLDMGISVSADGRSVEKALDYLAGYTGKKAPEWPHSQISGMEGKQQELLKDLYRAYLLNPSRTDYRRKYFSGRKLDYSDPFNLLYLEPRLADDAMTDILPQLRHAIACADSARKSKDNALRRRVTPRTVGKEGNLVMVHPHDWCSGFFAGSLWHAYQYSNLPEWRESAISWTWPIEEAKWHKGTHDLGFMMNDSFGKAYDLTGEQSYKDVVVRSAKTLISRYSPIVKSIRSWDHNAEVWKFPVIIDNLMNLEMLFQATRLTGDSIYHKVAVNHANTTLANHFRDDNSSYHVVDYDPATGAVRMKCTHQGYSDDSFWSRGQAWGLYGFAQCFNYTADRRYLDKSIAIADFILGMRNMPSDGIPYWDMKVPEIANLTDGQESDDVPRDASSGAVIASGLYMLADLMTSLPEFDSDKDLQNKAENYRRHADRILTGLTEKYRVPTEEKYGFILDHSTGHLPGNSEIDVPLNYADYYYLEALMRQPL